MAFADVIDVNKSPWGVSVYGSDNNNPVYFNKPYPGSTSTYELEFLPNSNTMKDLEDFYLYLTNGNDTYTAGIRKITVYYDFVD